jgi:hypothetical protein
MQEEQAFRQKDHVAAVECCFAAKPTTAEAALMASPRMGRAATHMVLSPV